MRRRFYALSIALLFAVTTISYAGPLDELAKVKDYASGRISSTDLTGGNFDGSQANPLKPGEMRVFADIKGPGAVSHMWFTLAPFNEQVLKGLVLRIYWDNEKTPSVEAPIGEFFGLGHGKEYGFDCLPFEIGNNRGLNCYFQMPFKSRARITLGNQGSEQVRALYYYIDYKKFETPQQDLLYFHAQYNQEKPAVTSSDYTILKANGKGHYVGCFYYIRANSRGWWGEGDDRIFVDGEAVSSITGTGTEDYFCHAWGMGGKQAGLRFGAPLYELASVPNGNENTLYRFHLEDAVTFKKSIKVTIEHGHSNNRKDDIATVAYWYQTEPHAAFPTLPTLDARRPWDVRMKELLDGKKYAEYRAAQNQIAKKSDVKSIVNDAVFNVAESYRLEGDVQNAERTYKLLAGDMLENETAIKVREALTSMGKDPREVLTGRIFLVSVADGHIIPHDIDGVSCYRTEINSRSPHIYFNVNDDWLKDTDQLVLLDIEYYDEGDPEDSFYVEYDSCLEGSETEQIYHRSPVFEKPGKKGWNNAILALERAKFANRQKQGADFRICCGGKKDMFIKSIKVLPENIPQK